ncbi:MAG: patatin-like phospholipase family protein [Myxococcales bacterium]|nr:patatin-like phospholipase family protein [Polyangiaceae bacterium]MDW8249325.1 patatin-like phospholipase family protein [Myxococcales bacterium]
MEPATIFRQNGITIISKHNPERRQGRPSKIALVLAGGAITGGAFKAGGLKALDELLSRGRMGDRGPLRLTDFDMFVGLSAGSILASALAGGISAEEIYRTTVGESSRFSPMQLLDFMRPNLREPPERVALFASKVAEILATYISGREDPVTGKPFTARQTILKLAQVVTRLAPTGFFDAEGIRRYLRRQSESSGLPQDFPELRRLRGKSLYITAVELNTGTQVVFGPEEHYEGVPIPDAVAASCGLPFWYRTVRVRNPRAGEPGERRWLDLADGGVVRTTNVGLALKRGADLVIVYNPFTPIRYNVPDRSLHEHGLYALSSQLFRILLGSRLDIGKDKVALDPSIQSDVVYIEPHSADLDFFQMNPLNFWSKRRAAMHGYSSVKAAFESCFDPLRQVLARHGIYLEPIPPRPRPRSDVIRGLA